MPHFRACDLVLCAIGAAAAAQMGGCAVSSTSQARFTPTSGDGGGEFRTELLRSCALDDCRTQAARLVLPNGEVMTGQLRMLTGGPVVADAISATQDRRPAIMTLAGDRGSRLQCELLFTAGARNARGVCKAQNGIAYVLTL